MDGIPMGQWLQPVEKLLIFFTIFTQLGPLYTRLFYQMIMIMKLKTKNGAIKEAKKPNDFSRKKTKQTNEKKVK